MELAKKKNSRKRNSTSSETAGLPTKKKYYCRKKNISLEEKTTTMMHIPKDVMFEIFLKLHVKSLLRLRWVCKYWFTSITDSCFVKMHLNNVNATNNPPLFLISSIIYRPRPILEFHSLNSLNDAIVNIKVPLPFNEFTSFLGEIPVILGSCNGLVCIHCFSNSSRYSKIFIWNPCTKQYKLIWRFDHLRPRSFSSYGFGYDCSTDDYKVIKNLCSLKDNGYNVETEVHTLGTSSLKTLEEDNRFFLNGVNGLFINGDLYWKARLTGSGPFTIIVAFDVAKEKYRQITSKPNINHDESNDMHLRNLKGCLCVLNVTTNYTSMEVWVMNRNIYNMKTDYSWDLLYTISAPWSNNFVNLLPLRFYRNGEFVIVKGKNLFLFDPKSKQSRILLPRVRGIVTIKTCVESLVPVKGGSYIDEPPSIAMDKPTIDGPSSIAMDKPTIDGPPSIAKGKRKREVKRPLRFQDEY